MDVDINAIRIVERALLKCSDGLLDSDTECSIQMGVQDVGQWVIKFRRSGVIVNNSQLICSDIYAGGITATITFKTLNGFLSILNGNLSFTEGISKGSITCTGSDRATALFLRKIGGTGDANSLHDDAPLDTGRKKESPSSNNSDAQDFPIKKGWLLKKGAIISGWRCRWFVVYPGRVEYFLDKHDPTPRGVIDLRGAQIYPARRCTVNGIADHWGWM